MTLGSAKEPIKPANGRISASAYAGKVHAAIARHRLGMRGGSGSATVTFSIGPAGGLRSASISRSSGKPQLDQAALASVRNASPFPPPPPGAKSTYSIQIYFR
jgi:protein TonB